MHINLCRYVCMGDLMMYVWMDGCMDGLMDWMDVDIC